MAQGPQPSATHLHVPRRRLGRALQRVRVRALLRLQLPSQPRHLLLVPGRQGQAGGAEDV
jgi:hypothetical protein